MNNPSQMHRRSEATELRITTYPIRSLGGNLRQSKKALTVTEEVLEARYENRENSKRRKENEQLQPVVAFHIGGEGTQPKLAHSSVPWERRGQFNSSLYQPPCPTSAGRRKKIQEPVVSVTAEAQTLQKTLLPPHLTTTLLWACLQQFLLPSLFLDIKKKITRHTKK